MNIIQAKIKPIMLVTGLLTCTMAYAIFFPHAALTSMFGESLNGGALAQIVVRSWGALITLVGAMLLYGAFREHQRPLILVVAGVSKLVYVTLLIVYGSAYFPLILMPVIVDSIAIVLFAICLAGDYREGLLLETPR
ncbi:MAG: hypothetical protein V7709_19875 [Halioglobus sp.]